MEGTGLHIEEIFLAFTLLLALAKLLGEATERLGQPAILGELVAGIILGSHLLGPLLFHTPLYKIESLAFLAEVGAIFLLFSAGYLEVDLKRLMQLGKESLIVAISGVTVTFVAGFAVGRMFNYGLIGSLFLGLALSITSIGVTVRTLMDLGKLQTDYGMIILGTAIIDDILSLFILAILVPIAQPDATLTIAGTGIIAFKIIAFFGGSALFAAFFLKPLAKFSIKFVVAEARLGIMFSVIFIFSYIAKAAGLHMIIGAFTAGVILSLQPEFKTRDIEYKVNGIAYGLFIPLFFAILGTMIDLGALVQGGMLAIVIIVVAILGKILAGFVGGKMVKYSSRKSLAIGVGLIPRTGVELVVISIALSAGIIDQKIFTAIVAMVAVTVIVTPILLKQAVAFLEKQEL
jgi:Kef-type K+ transport system membrane component KefB